MINTLKLGLFAALSLTVFSLHAAPSLYSAEVKVADQGDEARNEGLGKALGEVIVRVTGDRDAAVSSAGRSVTERARELIQQFGYKRVSAPDSESDDDQASSAASPATDSSDEPVPTELRLRVRFSRGAVNNALRQAGLPVWGSERPRTMLWITQTGGTTPSLVNGEQAEAVEQVARARGVPVVFPRQDQDERRRANAADVVAGYTDRLQSVARSYNSRHLLIGTISNDDGLWRGDWQLVDNGNTLEQWESSATEKHFLLRKAAHQLADKYARLYAVTASTTDSRVAVAINHVDSAKDFARVSKYLAGLTVVKSVIPSVVNQEYVIFQVDLSGDTEVLRRSISLADWLYEDETVLDLATPFAEAGLAAGYTLER